MKFTSRLALAGLLILATLSNFVAQDNLLAAQTAEKQTAEKQASEKQASEKQASEKQTAEKEPSKKEKASDDKLEEDKLEDDEKSDGENLKNRVDVLIITSDELAEAWQDFSKWKTCTGRPARVVITQEIEEDFEGPDIQAKIRQCCLKHINEFNTQWVILGGDSSEEAGIVPDRDTDHSEYRMAPYPKIPTDLYFISESDWDANDDEKYGVFSEDLDEVSYYNPKATIGRIPVRTAADVKAYTEKVIAYETKYPVGDFARRMVYTCPVEHAYPKLETSIDEVGEAWPTGFISRFFANKSPWDDLKKGDHDLSPDNWIEMINQRQASKIHIHGHGLLDLWVLEKNKTVEQEHIAKLKNERAYPIITTVSCLTGQFDDEQDPCIVESILRQPSAGAIAVLAPSRHGIPFMMSPSDFSLMMNEGKMDGTTSAYTKFWKCVLTEDLTLGEAFRKVKMDMETNARKNSGFHLCQCELNLLGDPSLRVHAKPPENFPRIRASRFGKKVKVRRAMEGARICIWDGADDYHELQADASGRVELEVASEARNYHVAAMYKGYNIWYQPAKSSAKSDESK